MDDMLIKFKEVVDEEIQAYESLGELYEIKQSILVQGKSDALWDIDAQIVSRADNIKELNQKRREIAKYLGNEDLTMSEIIEKAKEANNAIADKLETQKTKLQILIKSLTLQENTNMTLIKHGLTMVGKTIEIILSAFAPQGNKYDKTGNNVNSYEEHISSIVEEV